MDQIYFLLHIDEAVAPGWEDYYQPIRCRDTDNPNWLKARKYSPERCQECSKPKLRLIEGGVA